ncbi:integrase catalytic domain-containing protein [Trichonephila clavipes]|nr:integrase catalytic domain-containing protein [Trichonephila clavipes]
MYIIYPISPLNAVAFCSDIKQAFLQICLADEHKDAIRFLWSDDEPCVHERPKLQVYRFNRVNFGVCSSPFLLAATIRHHIEKYKHEFPDTVERLDRSFYVDDLISGGNEFEEALQTSRRAKNIMEAAGMDLRKWITNDANLMEQWKKENFNVHPVHETVSLGANGTKISGKKKFNGTTLCQHILKRSGKKWCEELPHLRNLKIPRLVLDSTLLEDDVELHSFCDASKKAYGAAIYLRTKSKNGISVTFVTSKSRVAPLNCVTLPRLELLGALVAARLASKGNKTRWKEFVANRVNEITSLTDLHSWYHYAGKETPADFLSGGLSADCLVSNSRWWTGAEFLSDSEFPKNFQQVVPELNYLTEHQKETVVQERKKLPEADRSEETVMLNNDSSSILDELLELSNNYFKVTNILSYIFRFNYNYGKGIVRVGGRLENASMPYLHKHPAILPKGSKLSKLYFNSLHTRLFHVGPHGLLNAVRQKFWPLSCRSIARKTVHQFWRLQTINNSSTERRSFETLNMVRKKQKNIFERHRNANPTPTTSHDASQPAATEEPPGKINMEIPLPNSPQASRPRTPEDFGPTS